MRSRLRAIGPLAVAVTVIGVWLWAGGNGINEQPGSQYRSPAVSIGDAESHQWTVLRNATGGSRPEFPRSLIAVDSQLCFGFERIDFGAPARPSLARCVERQALRGLGENSIASVFVVKTGLDTWHVVVFGDHPDAVSIVADDNVALAADRVFVGDAVIALRLANDAQVKSISWTVGRSRYLCRPASDAVVTGRFCG
jgi:hypothetical protein